MDDALIDHAVDRDRPLELPPLSFPAHYRCAVDASGGAIGGDYYTIAIAHKEDQRFVVDVVRGQRGPFDPRELTEDYARLAREFRCETVTGDLYGHQWTQQAWRDCGINYVPSDLNASMLYLECLPLFTRGLVSLPDHPILIKELRTLERIPGRIGKDQVTHPRNGHDDHANAVASVLRVLSNWMGYDQSYNWVSGPASISKAEATAQYVDNYRRNALAAYVMSGGMVRL